MLAFVGLISIAGGLLGLTAYEKRQTRKMSDQFWATQMENYKRQKAIESYNKMCENLNNKHDA